MSSSHLQLGQTIQKRAELYADAAGKPTAGLLDIGLPKVRGNIKIDKVEELMTYKQHSLESREKHRLPEYGLASL